MQFDQVAKGGEMTNPCSEFVVASFLEACRNKEFHHRWMTAETWSNLVRVYYKLSNDNAYTGKLLVKALSSNKHHNLNQQMQIVDVMNVPSDHIGIFRDKYRPRGQAFVYCFYATSRGGIPIKTEGIWFNSIDTATDLLSKVITRSENKYFR